MKNIKEFNANIGSKVRITDTHVYFLSGSFSQWAKSEFRQKLDQDGCILSFNCCEQYMMAGKAMLFGDAAHKKKVMAVQQREGEDFREVPKRQKAIGRDVENFNLATWVANARSIVFRGNWAKFTQNPAMLAQLLATGDRKIVEGASYDEVWGVKLDWSDPRILDEANWQGTNWLGEVLMKVREIARQCLADGVPFEDFDVWSVTSWSS